MHLPRPRRYSSLARWYDTLSGESVLYRSGRRAAVDLLRLRPGQRVLDVGCGTGLNFGLLVEGVGRSGEIVGIDASPAMLDRARERVERHAWPGITLVEADATEVAERVRGPFDAVVFAYSLAIVAQWPLAWRLAVSLVRDGGRVVVVDSAFPRGRWRLLAPFAIVAFLVGGVHPRREVWTRVCADTTDSAYRELKGGHVRVAAGTVSRAAEDVS